MAKIGYLARVIRGVRFKKINNMLNITKLKVMNYVPAIFVPIILVPIMAMLS